MIPVIRDNNNSDSEVVAYNPTSSSSSIPITQNRSRRSSVLDISGDDTIDNFASSLKRSINYLSTSLESSKLKPSNSPILNSPSSPLISTLEQRFSVNENTPLLVSQLANMSDSDLMDSNTFVTANSTLSTSEAGLPKTRKSSFISPMKSNAGACDVVEQVYYPDFIDKAIPHKSTPIQTIFNSINVLIGLGILSLPLALHLSGWIPGFICITLAAYSTRYSATLLGRILKEIPYLKTYHDIGVHVYGPKIGFFILISFTVDLFGAGVSMIILFSDSFNALFPQLSQVFFKVLIIIIMFLLNFLPLRILSIFSLLGIICTTSTCVTILVAGLIKTSLPGSLLHPMPTNLFPKSILDCCFALGLYLAPWGGHATFPEIYSDQSDPETYDSCMDYSFSFSYIIDFLTGVLGFLMFGKVVDDEITRNILTTEGYPGLIGSFIVILMGLLPISKLPLVSRPLLTAMDTFSTTENQQLGITRKTLNRLLLSSVFLGISLMVSSFGKVMSLLGSAICFTVCITLPILFYLRVFKSELRKTHTFILIMMVLVSILCTLCGSVAVIVK